MTIVYTKRRSYITLYNTYTLWYCKWQTETRSNHITINMGTKYKKENKITPLYTLNVEVILHYMTLTIYDIGNDT